MRHFERAATNIRPPVIAASLALLCMVTYWPVRNFDFVNLDDDLYVYENPHIRDGLTPQSVGWAFAADLLFETDNADYWAPMTVLSRLLDVSLFGLWPGGHHLMNVLLHALNTALLFLVLWRLTQARWRSAFVAALFAIHPIHVESVAWVTERKDVLAAFFWMLTLHAYVSFCRSPKPSRYALVLVTFALGLMAKPILVTLPAVLLLLDAWPLERVAVQRLKEARERRRLGRLVLEKVPLLILSLASAGVTMVAAGRGGSVRSLETISVTARICSTAIGYFLYLGKLAWPADLAVYYPLSNAGVSLVGLTAAIALLTVTVLVGWRFFRLPYAAVGWFWFLGVLVPVIGIVQVGEQSMADRFAYLPAIGLYIGVVWTLDHLAGRPNASALKPSLTALGSACLVALFVRTTQQVRVWQTSETLFRHAVSVTENNYLAHMNLGVELAQQGRYEEAIAQHRKAVAAHSTYALAHLNLGMALRALDQTAEAIGCYRQALAINPVLVSALLNLGAALAEKGEPDEAKAHFAEASRLAPMNPMPHVRLAFLYLDTGERQKARAAVSQALEKPLPTAAAATNLGVALLRLGETSGAVTVLTQAVNLQPSLVQAQVALGDALRATGEREQATGHYRNALRINPGFTEALVNLGATLLELGNCSDAVPFLQAAAERQPENAGIRGNLGKALRGIGDEDGAAKQLRESLRLAPNQADIHNELGGLRATQMKLTTAIDHFSTACQLSQSLHAARVNRARALRQLHRDAEAVKDLRTVLAAVPGWLPATALLAEILALSEDPGVRNPEEAVRLSEKVCRQTGHRDPAALRILANAHAAAGHQQTAADIAARAIEQARAAGLKELAAAIHADFQKDHGTTQE